MNIFIVGDGKVGFTLAEHLSQEEHNVTVIDTNSDALRRASESLDVMCVKGNGASLSALRESGVETADIVIAATSLDEVPSESRTSSPSPTMKVTLPVEPSTSASST